MHKIAIIGGGPAALTFAAHIDTDKYSVSLYEKNKAVGRKFLVAGEGGLNLTYNSALDALINCYHPSDFLSPIINQFSNKHLVDWLMKIGISTFIGTSNRVFPDKNYKPIQVLNKIIESIERNKVNIYTNTTWSGWNEKGQLCFENEQIKTYDIVIFALGGASWKVTGSDGQWSHLFSEHDIKVLPFRSANCAFKVEWNKNFLKSHEGKPLKNISLRYNDHNCKGELVITDFGIEGNAIYALSQQIQKALSTQDYATTYIDFKPTMTVDQIKNKFYNSTSTKITDILRRDINLNSAAIALIKQWTDKATFLNIDQLSKAIKSIPLIIHAADDLDKAISSLGGISLDEVDRNLQLKKLPNSYVIGEMLDWYAPTGGYLLQACFSMGAALAQYLNGKQ